MTLTSRLLPPPAPSLAAWSEHLRAGWGLRLRRPSTTAPLRLVATTECGLVLAFFGAGASLRLQLHEPAALRTVVVRPDCDCGADHGHTAVLREELDPLAVPRWEHRVDGHALHGWTGIRAATLDLSLAAAYLDRLLVEHAPALAAHGWRGPESAAGRSAA